jgi:hypothetical protein
MFVDIIPYQIIFEECKYINLEITDMADPYEFYKEITKLGFVTNKKSTIQILDELCDWLGIGANVCCKNINNLDWECYKVIVGRKNRIKVNILLTY